MNEQPPRDTDDDADEAEDAAEDRSLEMLRDIAATLGPHLQPLAEIFRKRRVAELRAFTFAHVALLLVIGAVVGIVGYAAVTALQANNTATAEKLLLPLISFAGGLGVGAGIFRRG
jgi:hypothetical protein